MHAGGRAYQNMSPQLTHRYTDAAVALFQKVINGEPYELDTGAVDVDKAGLAAAEKGHA